MGIGGGGGEDAASSSMSNSERCFCSTVGVEHSNCESDDDEEIVKVMYDIQFFVSQAVFEAKMDSVTF